MKSRDRLYIGAMVSAIMLVALTTALMIGFKKNEAFFDSRSHIGRLAEKEIKEALAQKERDNFIYQFTKKNIDIGIEDRKEGFLWIPLSGEVDKEDIDIRNEFSKNKFVINLKNAKGAITKNTTVISDSTIMDAVGVYTLKEDVGVEIYCNSNSAYECEMEVAQGGIRVNFVPVREKYDNIFVIYIPCNKRNMLYSDITSTNEKSLILSSAQLQEDYTQREIVDYANKVYAELLIGIDINEVASNQGLVVVYNDEFFIPEFGSIELAEKLSKNFEQALDIGLTGYMRCNQEDEIVKQAKVPSANVIISILKDESNFIETEYKLEHGIISAIENIINEREN